MKESWVIEVFSAGCPVCRELVEEICRTVCSCCEVWVLDAHDPQVARRMAELGVKAVPAVAIDVALADCCAGAGPDLKVLETFGLGREG